MRRSILAFLLLAFAGWAPAPASAADATIHVTDFAFDPASVTIAPGENVTWGFDEGTHSVVFDAGGPEGCPAASTGGSCTRAFPAAGSFSYHCGLHANMTGAIVVEQAAPPANQPPMAAFNVSSGDLTVLVDARGSSDADGSIASYEWDWGDGQSGEGLVANHTYAAPGTYPVKLTVTDDAGAVSSLVHEATLGDVAAPTPETEAPTVERAPTADFVSRVVNRTVEVDALSSSDAGGTIVAYEWDWGDGQTGSGPRTSHAYADVGTYAITLTVRDDAALHGTATRNVTIADPVAPAARMQVDALGLLVRVNASATTPGSGAVARFAWDFGDGAVGSGAVAEHLYPMAGNYTIRLVAQDASGMRSEAASTVSLTFFHAEAAGLNVSFDASRVQGAANRSATWDFGDGSNGTGLRVAHAYVAAGSYNVALRLVSGDLATTLARPLVVSEPPARSAPQAVTPPAEATGEIPLGWPLALAALAAGAVIARRR